MLNEESLRVLKCAANETRGLILDAVSVAKSGHLGLPLGCAEVGAALFGECLVFDASNPRWLNRDRFVLSAGHGSMFLYAWLHLAGFEISLDDLKNFRQKNSITPGHPEFGITLGVECTTGPLGQGIANAVGLAVSQKKIASYINTPGNCVINNRVVCLCGDGCLQEGISSEACSLAGHWKLDNLIIIYDSNKISLDSEIAKTQSDDVSKRFEAYGFEVFEVDGHNIKKFCEIYNLAKFSEKKSPKIIIAHTEIGHGIDEVAGTNKAHGESGVKFSKESKRKLGLPETDFFVSQETKDFFTKRSELLHCNSVEWQKTFDKNINNTNFVEKFSRNHEEYLTDFIKNIPEFVDNISTRVAFGIILNEYAKHNERVVTGSADLFSSTKNYLNNFGDFSSENHSGRNFYFGVREHAMAAIANGIAYDGYFDISCSTFLTFSDYMRPSIRVAALAKLPVKYIFTHDSVMVGEDGPTHQPVEIVASLRCIPNLYVIRPADAEECVGAIVLSENNNFSPSAIILSRQDLRLLNECSVQSRIDGVLRGGYIIYDELDELDAIILACGSEVQMAIDVAKKHRNVRVVSMPCMECFDHQSEEYIKTVLPDNCKKRIAIDFGVGISWYKYVGDSGKILSIESFGFSAKGEEVIEFFEIMIDKLEQTLSVI